jgi:hypothetical protein
MSDPVACRKITGFDDYEALENASIGTGEKLLVYTRVTGHTVEKAKASYRVHLLQDVNIRKKGQKRIVWGRKKILDYQGQTDDPTTRIYLGTTIALKGFPAGDYQAELMLTDALNPERTARQVLDFTITAK